MRKNSVKNTRIKSGRKYLSSVKNTDSLSHNARLNASAHPNL